MATNTSLMTGSPLAAERSAPIGLGRLRVMHVVNCLAWGGTEMGVLKLMQGLGDQHFDHRLCTTRSFDADFVHTYSLEKLLYVASSSREGLQFPLFRLKKIFEQYRPHIVHTRNWGALEAIPAARLAGVPIVIHSEHGYELENLAGLPRRQRTFRWLAYKMADRLFTVSRDLCEFHAKQAWVSPRRIGVIYNGVDTERFAPSRVTRNRVRQELGIPEDRLVVGSVGRMVSIKGYSTLLKAAEEPLGRISNVHILLVGTGPELESLRRQVSESRSLDGRVTFVGASDRIPELLNAMDIFVLPSLREGMSNTLLEAMACGLPLIVTRAGGNPEVVEDGQSGWLFKPGDLAGLANGVKSLAENPEMRSQLGRAARARAVAVFSLKGMMDRYRSLYFDAAIERGLAASPQSGTTEVGAYD